MDVILQATVNGLLMGSIYGLTALGLTLIFGIMKVINFAHGSILMVGMFAAYWLVELTGIHPYLALLVVVPLLFFFGYYMQAIVIQPVFKAERHVREPITVIIVTTGIWYVLDNLAMERIARQTRGMPPARELPRPERLEGRPRPGLPLAEMQQLRAEVQELQQAVRELRSMIRERSAPR